MSTIDSLIRTKLHSPFIRSKLVCRPRLQSQIEQGLRRPITLVIAPAGFGKTTLAASSIANISIPAAWLTLDKDDNRDGLFLNYLVASLQTADQTIGHEAAQLMATSAPGEVILTSLINDMDDAGTDIVLVLDDYHVITSKEVNSTVSFLLEHCPRALHMLITSRSDPPLPLSQLRARGQVLEIRAADLSFTGPETAQFLNDVMGLHLDNAAITVLEERTEGWIAGLQLAALSMRGHDDITGFIQRFSGTNRYVLDYLLEEVLVRQPPEIQHFLVCTSILERLSAPLCKALLRCIPENSELLNPPFSYSAEQITAILEYLDKRNLFIIPLDDQRIWYRYHHLFADLLQARLHQSSGDGDISALYRCASRWYEENGLVYEAIYHASLTSDNESIERLIGQNYMEMMQRGESLAIRFWTGKLSKEIIYQRPLLCAHEAMSRAWFGQLNEADEFLAQAEKHLQVPPTTPLSRFISGYVAYVKSRVVAMRGDLDHAISLGLAARENIPPDNHALQGGIGVMLGYAYFLKGDFVNAVHILSDTIRSGIAACAVNTTVGAFCVLARIYAVRGRLHRSYELYQEAANFVNELNGHHLGAMSIIDIGIASVMYEWNDLDAASSFIQKGLASVEFWSKADDVALAHTTCSLIQQAQGRLDDAVTSMNTASQVITSSGVFSEARDTVAAARITISIVQNHTSEAGRQADLPDVGIKPKPQIQFQNELQHITLARVYMAHERLDDALDLLSRLEVYARKDGRNGSVLRILVLKALALKNSGDLAQALSTLEECLIFAKPEGYIRVFLNEGQPMQLLVAQWLARDNNRALRDYANYLLTQFSEDQHIQTLVRADTSANYGLIESLTERETEILHIIALGKTNQEIARELVVARGTVKAHTASIYRKLDVSNRTEAVARARQLGILP